MSDVGKVTVVGAGIIGLSAAYVLADQGYDVLVVADERPPETTSAKAAAFWEPFHADGLDAAWGAESYKHFTSLVGRDGSGVFRTTVRRYFGSDAERRDWELKNPWHAAIEGLNYRPMPRAQVHPDFAEGSLYEVPVIHMPLHLANLERQLRALPNVSFAYRKVLRLGDELGSCDAVINSTGLGSGELADVHDAAMYSCRGQVVIIEPLKEIDALTFVTTGRYESRPLYIVPRGLLDVVLGGTTDDNAWDLTPNPAVTEEIIERCARHYPAIRTARIREVKVGRRPARHGPVRFGRDVTSGFAGCVIHNYGHGGAGVTLSWGCAQAVLKNLRSDQPVAAPA